MTRTQLKEMENECQFIEENLEKKLENETQLTQKYVDTRIDAFQKHGISGTCHLGLANYRPQANAITISLKQTHSRILRICSTH